MVHLLSRGSLAGTPDRCRLSAPPAATRSRPEGIHREASGRSWVSEQRWLIPLRGCGGPQHWPIPPARLWWPSVPMGCLQEEPQAPGRSLPAKCPPCFPGWSPFLNLSPALLPLRQRGQLCPHWWFLFNTAGESMRAQGPGHHSLTRAWVFLGLGIQCLGCWRGSGSPCSGGVLGPSTLTSQTVPDRKALCHQWYLSFLIQFRVFLNPA